MIIDVNAYLGRWPFMPLKYETAKDILALMDRAGIDKAVVTSLNSVFYYNYEAGNFELCEVCKQYSGRLIPFAVINLNFVNWRDHLRECVDKYGVKGVKLHPDYHKYSLLSNDMSKLAEEARKLNLPIFIQTSLLDMRHHPGYCFVPETSILEVAQVINQYRENVFIVGGGKHFSSTVQQLLRYASKNQNFYISSDGLGGPFDCIERLIEQIGSSRLLFGTRMPILYAEASKLMIEKSDISEDDKRKILGENAKKIFSLIEE